MTTSRVIRGTRAKVFLYICAILIIVGIIACYNNTLSQLDEVRKDNDVCHQQEENLSTQLQVISDYKQKLEKSLKAEQAAHQQVKTNLDNQLNDERNKYEKEANDMKLKLGSLQQHFNLLQTQYDDQKEATSKTQKQKQEEINNLEARISELLEEQKKLKSSKDNLKLQYDHVQHEKKVLEKRLEHGDEVAQLKKENEDLKLQIQQLKAKCPPEYLMPEQQNAEENLPKETEVQKSSETVPKLADGNGRQELRVLPQPNNDNSKLSPSSSTASNKIPIKPSQGNLVGARPLFVPTVTPETLAKEKKVPEGVVAIPEKKEEEIVNARYQNAKDSAQNDMQAQNEQLQIPKAKFGKDDADKDTAHEIFDAPLIHDGLQFGDNDQIKQVGDKPNFDKRHIDTLGKDKKNYDQDQVEYKELQNDVQLEENDDDDGDGYDDHLAKQKEPAIRN